jgi:hypothetical protein
MAARLGTEPEADAGGETERLIMRPELPVLLQASAVAELLYVRVETLAKWRRHGRGPEFLRLSAKRVLYAQDAVELWLESRRRRGGIANAPDGRPRSAHLGTVPPPVRSARQDAQREPRFSGHRTRHESPEEWAKRKG